MIAQDLAPHFFDFTAFQIAQLKDHRKPATGGSRLGPRPHRAANFAVFALAQTYGQPICALYDQG